MAEEDTSGELPDGSGTNGDGTGGTGGGSTSDQPTGSGGGTSDGPVEPIGDEDVTPTDPVEIPPIPYDGYRGLRYSNTYLGPPVEAGASTPATYPFIPEPFRFTAQEPGVSFRFQGFINFPNSIQNFACQYTDGARVFVDDRLIIDDWRIQIGTANKTTRVLEPVTAGYHLITIEWFTTTSTAGNGFINLVYQSQEGAGWTSCEDGIVRPGVPPEDWILQPEGCYAPPPPVPDPDDPTIPAPDPTDPIPLEDIVTILPDTPIERTYVKDSFRLIGSHRLRFFNRSTNMEVDCQLRGPSIVDYRTLEGSSIRSFTLPPQWLFDIDVAFIVEEVNTLAEGLSLSNVVLDLVSGRMTEDGPVQVGGDINQNPDQPNDPIPTPDDPDPTDPNPDETPPPAETWDDCSTGVRITRSGSPPAGWYVADDGCWYPIIVADPIPNISIGIAYSATAAFALHEGKIFAQADIQCVVAGDGVDPDSYSYLWNFDINGDGAGFGTNTTRTTEATWIMSDQDQIKIQDQGYTTRTVSVIVSKDSTSEFYTRKETLILDAVADFYPSNTPQTDAVVDDSGLNPTGSIAF